MSEYKKKVSGVTNILIRDAHGKRKIDHGAWNDELNNDSSESNRRKSRRKKNTDKLPISALYICVFIAWIILFVPIPILNYFIAFPLLITAFVLSIICIVRNSLAHGIMGFFMLFVASPIIYLVSIGTFLSLLSDSLDNYTSSNKPVPVMHSKQSNVVKPNYQQSKVVIPSLHKQPAIVPKQPVIKKYDTPELKYKYLISFNDGRNVVADSLTVSGNILNYSMGSIRVSLDKSEVKSYKKLAIR